MSCHVYSSTYTGPALVFHGLSSLLESPIGPHTAQLHRIPRIPGRSDEFRFLPFILETETFRFLLSPLSHPPPSLFPDSRHELFSGTMRSRWTVKGSRSARTLSPAMMWKLNGQPLFGGGGGGEEDERGSVLEGDSEEFCSLSPMQVPLVWVNLRLELLGHSNVWLMVVRTGALLSEQRIYAFAAILLAGFVCMFLVSPNLKLCCWYPFSISEAVKGFRLLHSVWNCTGDEL